MAASARTRRRLSGRAAAPRLLQAAAAAAAATSASGTRDSEPAAADLENILKEMTQVLPPLTAIATPRKEPDCKFTFHDAIADPIMAPLPSAAAPLRPAPALTASTRLGGGGGFAHAPPSLLAPGLLLATDLDADLQLSTDSDDGERVPAPPPRPPARSTSSESSSSSSSSSEGGRLGPGPSAAAAAASAAASASAAQEHPLGRGVLGAASAAAAGGSADAGSDCDMMNVEMAPAPDLLAPLVSPPPPIVSPPPPPPPAQHRPAPARPPRHALTPLQRSDRPRLRQRVHSESSAQLPPPHTATGPGARAAVGGAQRLPSPRASPPGRSRVAPPATRHVAAACLGGCPHPPAPAARHRKDRPSANLEASAKP
ncbi:Lilli_1 protein, partial [Gryllus bimaculatus]